MARDTTTVICSRCRVPADVAPTGRDSDPVTCPKCGAHQTLRQVEESILEQKAAEASKRLLAGLKSSKYLTVKTRPTPARRHIFTLGD